MNGPDEARGRPWPTVPQQAIEELVDKLAKGKISAEGLAKRSAVLLRRAFRADDPFSQARRDG